MLSEKSQSAKVTRCVIPFIEHFRNSRISEMQDRLVAARSWREGWGGKLEVVTGGREEPLRVWDCSARAVEEETGTSMKQNVQNRSNCTELKTHTTEYR